MEAVAESALSFLQISNPPVSEELLLTSASLGLLTIASRRASPSEAASTTSKFARRRIKLVAVRLALLLSRWRMIFTPVIDIRDFSNSPHVRGFCAKPAKLLENSHLVILSVEASKYKSANPNRLMKPTRALRVGIWLPNSSPFDQPILQYSIDEDQPQQIPVT